jgi:hypothetical protein
MTQNLFTTSSCSLELQNTWIPYELKLLLDIKVDYSHRVQEVDCYCVGQIEHCESVQTNLCKRWYPVVLQTFLSPPSDKRLPKVVAARDNRFHAVSVLVARQLRGLIEATCASLAEYFEMIPAVEEDGLMLVVMGKSMLKIMPAFLVKLTLSGSHIQVIPSLKEIDASIGSMLDRAVEACDNFPSLTTLILPAYSPLSDAATTGHVEAVLASQEKVQADSVATAAQVLKFIRGRPSRKSACCSSWGGFIRAHKAADSCCTHS